MKLSINAVAYALEQLAIRSGISDYELNGSSYRFLDLPIYYGDEAEERTQTPAIFIRRCSSQEWIGLLQMKPGQLKWLSDRVTMPDGHSLPVGDSIPALFLGSIDREKDPSGCSPRFAEYRPNGSLVIHVDIIAATIFMLTRWEETVNEQRDKHDRFPAVASVAHMHSFLDRPLVDEYALVLKAWIEHMRSEWQPKLPRFQVKLTHDIDYTRRCSNPIQLAKAVANDLVRQKSLSQSANTVRGALFPSKDVYLQGVYTLAALSKSVGLSSAFYFMAAPMTAYDSGYDCGSPLLKKCYADLSMMGFSIGFHPSYYTLDNPEKLAIEMSKLTTATGQQIVEGRHHYLRFRVADTWRHWEQVGLKHDLSLGYAEEEGFRCGTCHTFQVFDLENDKLLELHETPLIVMDATLKLYQNLTPEAGQKRILELAKVCKAVNGTFCLLWHNYALVNQWKNWKGTYQETLKYLALMT